MSTLELTFYDFLKTKYSDKDAKLFLEFIEEKTTQKVTSKSELFEQIIQKDVINLEGKMLLKITETEGKLDTKISESKADIIKWMFIFWIGSTIATIGSLIAIIKFMVVR